MNRRESFQSLFAAGGALLTLPTWATKWTIADLKTQTNIFSSAEASMISAVADTIIPQGDSIGAISVGVDRFLIKLFSDCYGPEVHANIKTQLKKLGTFALDKHQKDFARVDQKQREELLTMFYNSADKDEKDFFSLVKSETIRGFNTSKEVMTTYLKYKTVPGHYYGCVDLKQS